MRMVVALAIRSVAMTEVAMAEQTDVKLGFLMGAQSADNLVKSSEYSADSY
jgi:hypothetical protein